MSYTVDNAIIMAAGLSSRFVPLSYEKPKALVEVKGEVLIERQIKQLIEAGITKIYLVVGYKKNLFYYLKDKYDIYIIENDEYNVRNNNSSIYAARNVLKNSYICSADNYFINNPFEKEVDESYYSSVFVEGQTNEWCINYDKNDYISDVTIGGENSWVMLGHTFWNEKFSNSFIKILEDVYNEPETKDKYWENIYIENIDVLKMKIKKYEKNFIFEFDSLEELREFDNSYNCDTRSSVLKKIAHDLNISESYIKNINAIKDMGQVIGFTYTVFDESYEYYFKEEFKNE